MTCALNLITLGGFGVAVMAGITTDVLLARAGYQPKNYLAEWRQRRQTRTKSLPA